MKYKGFSVYDNKDFFRKYTEKRSRGNSPNELIEQPIIDELIGSVSGKKILDLGCGDGKYGVNLIRKGAKFYNGIEGSTNMSALAKRNLKGLNGKIKEGDIEKTNFKLAEYDLIISRLVLHYIEDLKPLLLKLNSCLKEEGEFVFSIEHPVITSNYESYDKKKKRGNWVVDNYFNTGERINEWIGKKVVKYHRTIEEYWQLIKKSNFEIVEIKESKPNKSNFKIISEFDRRKRIPLFLFFKLKRKTKTQ